MAREKRLIVKINYSIHIICSCILLYYCKVILRFHQMKVIHCKKKILVIIITDLAKRLFKFPMFALAPQP